MNASASKRLGYPTRFDKAAEAWILDIRFRGIMPSHLKPIAVVAVRDVVVVARFAVDSEVPLVVIVVADAYVSGVEIVVVIAAAAARWAFDGMIARLAGLVSTVPGGTRKWRFELRRRQRLRWISPHRKRRYR